MPELPDELLVSAAWSSSPVTESRTWLSVALPMLGVRGWEKSSGGLGVSGSSRQVEASSSGRNVDTEGEVVSDSGSRSAPSRVGSVDICR